MGEPVRDLIRTEFHVIERWVEVTGAVPGGPVGLTPPFARADTHVQTGGWGIFHAFDGFSVLKTPRNDLTADLSVARLTFSYLAFIGREMDLGLRSLALGSGAVCPPLVPPVASPRVLCVSLPRGASALLLYFDDIRVYFLK